MKTPPSDIVPPTGIPSPLHGTYFLLRAHNKEAALTRKQSILLVNTQQMIFGDFSAGVCCIANDFFVVVRGNFQSVVLQPLHCLARNDFLADKMIIFSSERIGSLLLGAE